MRLQRAPGCRRSTPTCCAIPVGSRSPTAVSTSASSRIISVTAIPSIPSTIHDVVYRVPAGEEWGLVRKDAGAEYQPLTSEQRALFQDLLNDVLAQFKAAIVEGRNMKPEVLDQYADGRVFTGSQAVKLGFATRWGLGTTRVERSAK